MGAFAHELLRYAESRAPEDFIFQRKDSGLIDDRDLQRHVLRPATTIAGISH